MFIKGEKIQILLILPPLLTDYNECDDEREEDVVDHDDISQSNGDDEIESEVECMQERPFPE